MKTVENSLDPKVWVVIPAHDEAGSIERSLRSITRQTRCADRRLVVADNCTDATGEIVYHFGGWDLMRTESNEEKKAGALNQAWARIETELGPDDVVLAMDADTQLAPDFIENALAHLQRNPELGAICATFYGRGGGGPLGFLQRMEYARFARWIGRKKGRTFVLSGTATAFRASVLADLKRERGYIWDGRSIIEDYEISLSLRVRGVGILAPRDCRVETDVMETASALWRQRVRWQRGTLTELRQYGVNRGTAPDWGRQALLAGAVTARFLLVSVVLATLLLFAGIEIRWEWTALIGVVALERMVSVWRLGWRYALVAATVIPEEIYAVFREACFCRSTWLTLTADSWEWHQT